MPMPHPWGCPVRGLDGETIDVLTFLAQLLGGAIGKVQRDFDRVCCFCVDIILERLTLC